MLNTIKALYDINRCLLSDGQDKALNWLLKKVDKDNSRLLKFASGEKVFTWTVPQKWELYRAELLDSTDHKQIFTDKDQLLHVMVGSLPFKGRVTFEELDKHLHFRKDYPQAIPYAMRFYQNKDWGLCLSYNQYLKLPKSHQYEVSIVSKWTPGNLKVLEVTIPGKVSDEIHLLAHVDHPWQANDNLSGVAVLLELYRDLKKSKPQHTLKFIFHSETIGTIAYLSKRQKEFNKIAGAIVLDIVGNENSFLFQKTYSQKSNLDLATEYVFKKHFKKFRTANFQEMIGSEECTYNDPKIGIPGVLISTYPYKQYHTHFDNPAIISEQQLQKAKTVVLDILGLIDQDFVPNRKYIGPLLRGPLGWFLDKMEENTKLDLWQYNLDGIKSVIQAASEVNLDLEQALKFALDLKKRGLLL